VSVNHLIAIMLDGNGDNHAAASLRALLKARRCIGRQARQPGRSNEVLKSDEVLRIINHIFPTTLTPSSRHHPRTLSATLPLRSSSSIFPTLAVSVDQSAVQRLGALDLRFPSQRHQCWVGLA
jgi:hypothetical protein